MNYVYCINNLLSTMLTVNLPNTVKANSSHKHFELAENVLNPQALQEVDEFFFIRFGEM